MAAREKQRTVRCMGRNVAALLLLLFAPAASLAQAAVESVAPVRLWCYGNPCTYATDIAAARAQEADYNARFAATNPYHAYLVIVSCNGYGVCLYHFVNDLWTTADGPLYIRSDYPACPIPTVNPTIPYTYKNASGMCEREAPVATCPVTALTPLDPALQPYEDGLVDMENETQATREGAACIVRSARAHRPRINAIIVSGYRPQAYQTHIREVYDKWQLLENNNDAECADIKNQIKAEFDHHGPFAHQPGNTSRHSTGRAVDISLTNYADADAIAAGCVVTGGSAMSRPVANDRSHFESPR